MPADTRRNAVAAIPHRLANLDTGNGFCLAVEKGQRLLDVPATARRLGVSAPMDLDEMLQSGLGDEVQRIADVASSTDAVFVDAAKIRFGPTVSRPRKIICVGFNYLTHAQEAQTPLPAVPALFNKFDNALLGHGGTITLPVHVAERFDYETELVIVMGVRCENVAEANALDYVAGYATGNDLSARDLQMATSQFMLGKTSTGFAPIGPWLVPASLVPDPQRLRLTTTVNGELRQDGTTADMIFDCRRLISFASNVFPLEPGDVIFTGTPHGVILGQTGPPEQHRWLRAGDEITSSVEGLGDLEVTLA